MAAERVPEADQRRPRRRSAPQPETRTEHSGERLRRKLANRRELRDAFLIHEIIGPPVSLRRPDDLPPGAR